MITLKLTNSAVDEILHCLRTSYLDYEDRLGAMYNDSIRFYNEKLDELIQDIKDQVKEQEVQNA